MERKQDYFDDLKTIKKIMEESSRFLSLSGLAGLFAGILALIGSVLAYTVILGNSAAIDSDLFSGRLAEEVSLMKTMLILDALVVLLLAIALSIYFSYRKSVASHQRIWTPVSKRLLISLILPLFTGGIFILILYAESQWQLIVPTMLIFYGLALLNAGKFTYSEVFYFGIIEIITGLISAILPEYGLFFWSFGFGILHIAYGLFMYRKYEG